VAALQLGRHSIVKPTESYQVTIQEAYTDYRQRNTMSWPIRASPPSIKRMRRVPGVSCDSVLILLCIPASFQLLWRCAVFVQFEVILSDFHPIE
jgi:hypothetical protein